MGWPTQGRSPTPGSSRWGEIPIGGSVQGPSPYHDAGEQAHALPAVGVGHHVAVANGEEGDGNEPHGPQEVAGHFLLVVVPGGSQEGPGQPTLVPLPASCSLGQHQDSGALGPPGCVGGLDLRQLIMLRAQSDKDATAGLGGGWLSPGSPTVLLRAPRPPPQHSFQTPPFAQPPGCCPGHRPSPGLVTGQRGTWVRACPHNPPPQDRHTDRLGYGWPRTPEAAGSGARI